MTALVGCCQRARLEHYADQKSLLQTKARLNDLVAEMNKVKDSVAVTNDHLPPLRSPSFGFLRATTKDVPRLADTVTERAEHAKEHLTNSLYRRTLKKRRRIWRTHSRIMSLQEKMDTLKRREDCLHRRLHNSARRLVELFKEIARGNRGCAFAGFAAVHAFGGEL